MIDIDPIHQQLVESEACDECGSEWKHGIDEAFNCSNADCNEQFFYYPCQLCGRESCPEAFINEFNVKNNCDQSDTEELRYCCQDNIAYMMCEKCPHYMTFISFKSITDKVYEGSNKKCIYIPDEETKAGTWTWQCDHCDETQIYSAN